MTKQEQAQLRDIKIKLEQIRAEAPQVARYSAGMANQSIANKILDVIRDLHEVIGDE